MHPFYYDHQLKFTHDFDIQVIENSSSPDITDQQFITHIQNLINMLKVVFDDQPTIESTTSYISFNQLRYEVTLDR